MNIEPHPCAIEVYCDTCSSPIGRVDMRDFITGEYGEDDPDPDVFTCKTCDENADISSPFYGRLGTEHCAYWGKNWELLGYIVLVERAESEREEMARLVHRHACQGCMTGILSREEIAERDRGPDDEHGPPK